MKIVFIGSGNVGTHMSLAMKTAGCEIAQVYSRTQAHARELADRVGAEPVNDIGQICRNANLYIFSVKDDVLPEIIARMPETSGVWVHTAGSVPLSVLSRQEERGVIYPLQTFSRNRQVNFYDIPLFIEASSNKTEGLLKDLAETISGNVYIFPGEKRQILHLAAVFACNFTNHMYALASEIMANEDIPFHLLNPLINETASKVISMSPQDAQTGPAVRFDEKVIQSHLELLKDPMRKEIYALLSKSIYYVSKGKGLKYN
ncbi:Rossmann-like and DUF2520 domain-containing protein [Proteiniphilum sp. UBA5384]|uniref:Rossmann-like and DUF2520 domain-containing protein n=1 Tax=Proteiniphilum sp. UBA5384 TaxID=1947279 RepID=UPI0025E64036|nr:Rossmann-like and DUF2520 domain-containing protein [Proteiniphilum sp. UBA5384]